jgi:hypothetical protein
LYLVFRMTPVTDRCLIADGELLSYRKYARTSTAGAGRPGFKGF